MGGVGKDTEGGAQAVRFNFRTKAREWEWRGMWPDGDPMSPPDNYLRVLVNARLESGAVVARPGQSAIVSNLHNAAASIVSLQDFQRSTPKQLFATSDGCPGSGPPALGQGLAVYDLDLSPSAQGVIYFSSATLALVMAVFDGALYLGVDNTLRKYHQLTPQWGQGTILTIAGNTLDKTILTLPAGFTQITCLDVFDGKLFVGCKQGAGNSKIAVWDGVTFTDDLTTINVPVGFGRYRETIVAYLTGVNSLRSRPIGVPGTAWSTIAPVAGTVAMRGQRCGASYRDVFYFASGGEDLWQLSGTTLTRIPVATWGGPAGCVTHSCFVFNNLLYVTYYTVAPAVVVARLAKFNGTTWTPIEKDFTAQVSWQTIVGPMDEYNGNLVVGGRGVVFESPGTTTSGTWTVNTLPFSSGISGSVNHLQAL